MLLYSLLFLFPVPYGLLCQESRALKAETREILDDYLDSQFQCKFDLQVDGTIDHCNYTLDVSKYGLHSWKLNIGLNSYWIGGPAKDADGRVSSGYVFVDLSSFKTSGLERKAWLVSDVFGPTTARGNCFTFHFSIDSLNFQSLSLKRVDILKISKTPSSTNEDTANKLSSTDKLSLAFGANGVQLQTSSVWMWEDSTEGGWRQAHLTYSTPNPHFFIFESVPKDNTEIYRGYAALDNIQIVEGVCGSDCNFDAGFSTCSWKNVADGDDFDWSASRGSRKSFTGPIRDKDSTQFSSDYGGYAYIDSGYPRHPGDAAILQLTEEVLTEPDRPLCLVFHVNLYGSGLGSLILVQENAEDSTRSTLWELIRPASSPRDVWHRAEVTISSQTKVKLFFEATVGEPGRGDIALDSISLQDGPCVIKPHEAARYKSVSCDFNSDLCGYLSQNLPTEEGAGSPPLWYRVQGGGRLPPGHGAGGRDQEDWFAVFDVKNYQHRPLDRGYLIGPQIPISAQPLCVSFWYYMATEVSSNPYLGTLSLMLIPRNVTGDQLTSLAEPRIIWSLTNQQESQWRYGQVSFVPNNPYLLAFEGVRASNVLGVVGIDDVTLFPGRCTQKPAKSRVNPGDCSFELDTCGWKPLNPGSALELRPQDWKLADRNQNFGSLRDHTFQLDASGYIYFDTINIQTKTWLISPRVEPNLSVCLRFYFATASSDSSNLQVRRQFSNGTMGDLWSVRYSDLELPAGSMVSPWLPAQIFIPSLSSDSAVIFEGNSNDGGFALDDVSMHPSEEVSCPTRPVYRSAVSSREKPFTFASLQAKDSRFKMTANRIPGLGSLDLFRESRDLLTDQQENHADDEGSEDVKNS